MSIALNPAAVVAAKRFIQEGKIKNDEGHWGQHNPKADAENKFLDQHAIAEYGQWHLGLDLSKGEETKGRYHFPYGDFKTVHRDGLIAAKERAAQQGYQDIEKAADELLQLLEKQAG
jgi:hypothetical protein